MGDVVLAEGSRGDLVRVLQECLVGQGYPVGTLDGHFGFKTAAAVQSFQADSGLPATGEADPATWTAITRMDPPHLRQRALQLTAAFEGHGYTLAKGNFDGSGITWGIVGFTLRRGQIQTVLKEALARDRAFVEICFGEETPELLAILDRQIPDQIAWADRHSSGTFKVLLAEPWRSHFRAFGESPAVQMLQLNRVYEDYFEPALETAARLGLRSELGIALCFDIHVQNGGIRPTAEQTIAARRTPGMTESDLRVLVATSVASLARSEVRKDVLDRKLAIARGAGTVHGTDYALRNWGLGESSASDDPIPRASDVAEPLQAAP